MRRGSICCLLDLVRSSLGKRDGEKPQKVVIGGLYDDIGLNEGLPLAYERAELIGSEVEAVEVGQAVLALNLIHTKLDFAERMVLILLEIGERNLEYSAFQRIVCVFETSGTVDEGFPDAAEGFKLVKVSLRHGSVPIGSLTLGSRKFLGL